MSASARSESTAGAVLLVRHGEANFDLIAAFDPVYRGSRYDFAPLTAIGVQQVEDLADQWPGRRPALVVSSPYTRTLQTAAILAPRLGCELRVDPGLHDWLPLRDGTHPVTAEIVQAKIAEYEEHRTRGVLSPSRTWETDSEMADRLLAAVARHGSRTPLVVVTHEAVIKAVVSTPVVRLASVHVLPGSPGNGGRH